MVHFSEVFQGFSFLLSQLLGGCLGDTHFFQVDPGVIQVCVDCWLFWARVVPSVSI